MNKEKCVRMAAGAVAVLMICGVGTIARAQDQPQQHYQTFYLKNATSQNAANDISTAMRNVMPRAKIYYAETENALLIGGTVEELAQAEKILNDLDKPQKVYRVTYTFADGHASPRHLSMLVSRGRTAIAKQGARVPIITGSYKSDGNDPSNTQFQYADIGLSAEARMEGYGDGLRLISKIEETNISEQKSNVGIQDPVVDQSVLQAQSAVNSAKPMTLGTLDMAEGKHLDVQVSIEAVQ